MIMEYVILLGMVGNIPTIPCIPTMELTTFPARFPSRVFTWGASRTNEDSNYDP